MLAEIARFRPFSPPRVVMAGLVPASERAPDIKPLGVGITRLPHAIREFSAPGIGDALTAAGIENRESCYYNRFGQLIYKQPRGKFAGYQYPEVGIRRGGLHLILYETALERQGRDAVRTDHECTGVEQG
jgi:5-methylphenazine-1-carboxylate 1-monooxygenase